MATDILDEVGQGREIDPAAGILGINRGTLRKKLRSYSIIQ